MEPEVNNFLMEQTEYSEKRLRSLLKPFLQYLRDKDVEIDEFDQTEVIEYIANEEYKNYAERVKNGNKKELGNETLLQVYYGLTDLIKFQRDNAEDREEHFKHNQRLARVKRLKKKRLKSLTRQKKRESTSRKWLSIEELDKLLKFTYELSEKDFVRFYLLGYFGFRRGELFGDNRIQEIDWDENRLVVLSEKSFYERVLFFNDFTKNLLKQATDKGLLEQFPYWRMKEYKGIPQQIDLSPHNFRYTFNHHMKKVINQLALDRKIQEDADLLLKSLMGHTTDQDMSSYYDSATEKAIREVMVDNHYFDDLQIVHMF